MKVFYNYLRIDSQAAHARPLEALEWPERAAFFPGKLPSRGSA
jgi:hypothetical protein